MDPVSWPYHFFHENTTLIHNKTLGHTRRAVETLHEIFRIEQRRETEAVALYERRHHLCFQRIEAHCENFELAAV